MENPTKKQKLSVTTTLVWFRSDLRTLDNTALYRSKVLGKPVVGLFVISPQEWTNHDFSPAKVDFILRNVDLLKKKLLEIGIPLLVVLERDSKNIPRLVLDVAVKVQAENVFWNIEYEVNESKRDSIARNLLEEGGIKVYELHDQCVIQPGTVRTKEGKIYHVFTPFKNSWISHVYKNPDLLKMGSIENQNHKFSKELEIFLEEHGSIPKSEDLGFSLRDLEIDIEKEWPAGEDEAIKRLHLFLSSEKSGVYNVKRDFPNIDGTSRLSAYLAIGVISPRVCINEARKKNGGKMESGQPGLVVWMSELIWREFYKNILFAYPHVCKNKAFKVEMDSIPWSYDQDKFLKWCQGKTGYPIVDAGMRQLNKTGWMHNRLRMIVVSCSICGLIILVNVFNKTPLDRLVKLFYKSHDSQERRLGEKYFMQHLIDGDFSANNGGWQWSSSTGTDSQPYFRIFNPLLQSEKFDAEGRFIRKYVPELQNVPSTAIHDPFHKLSANQFAQLGYPKPIVDHKSARDLCLETFKSTLSKFKK